MRPGRPRSAAATLTLRSHAPPASAHLLASGQVIASPETSLRFRVDRLAGAGGFGQVYLARRIGRSSSVPSIVCIKVSPHIDGWVREAYFGQLLEDHPRAIRLFDRFALPGRDGRTLFYLVLEYAPHGDLSSYLRRAGEDKGWGERIARREIAGILTVLEKLHRGRLLHRDLTPLNVFVCEGKRLKLGDFGIVRYQSQRQGILARTLNPYMAPSELVDGEAPKWQARDDVYQVGQLLAMLVKGDAKSRVRTGEVRSLRCSDHLKEIVHRCIGERRKRYEDANELIEALKNPPAALAAGVLRSLKGTHLAFTGILSRPRKDAVKAARRAGAIVHGGPSARTSVVVRGRPNPLQAAGREGGLKLMEVKRLREKGHRIVLLDERRFWRLVPEVRARAAARVRPARRARARGAGRTGRH
jgi:serine/threonine protein kinase